MLNTILLTVIQYCFSQYYTHSHLQTVIQTEIQNTNILINVEALTCELVILFMTYSVIPGAAYNGPTV